MIVIRFAVIGTSTITRNFLTVAAEVPRLQFAGAYSRSLERAKAFGAEYGARLAFDSLDALAEDERAAALGLRQNSNIGCDVGKIYSTGEMG